MNIPAKWAYLAVFVGVIGHASSEFFAVMSGIPGVEVSVWRFVLGGAGLIVLALCLAGSRDLFLPMKTHAFEIIWYSLIGVTGAYLAFHWALDFASVIQVATLVTTIPIFVGLTNLFINRQPFTPVKIATGLCATVAIAFLITDGAVDNLLQKGNSIIGILLAILCAFCAAYYAVKIKPIISVYGALRITAISMMIGGIGLWIFVGLFFSMWVDFTTLFDRPQIVWSSLLILAFWNTTITQFLWIGGLAAAPDITRASYLFFLKPVIAALLAIVILGESLTFFKAAAILVVTCSVLIEMYFPQRPGQVK